MKRSILVAAAMAASLSLAACAGVTVRPTTGPDDVTTRGFRLPERKPLVVLFGNKVDVLWVCNPNRSTAMEFGAFAAKHKFKMNFDSCGAPKDVDSDVDATDVPLALIDLLKDIAEKTVPPDGKTVSGTDTPGGVAAFQVFDVRFAVDDSVTLVPLVDPHDIFYVKVPVATAGTQIDTIPDDPPPTVGGS